MEYEKFLELLKYRRTIRRFKPDPIPDEHVMKILEAARYSMSGGNSQPWEFIVVKDPAIKEKVFNVYQDFDFELIWWLEQQRTPEYRHPAFNVPVEEKDKAKKMQGGWKDAPVYIVVLEDPRKQFGSVLAARADLDSDSLSVLASTMGHLSMVMNLAAASLGLGAQRVDICNKSLYREVLKFPEPLRVTIILPIGYRAYEPGPPHRLPLEQMLHFDEYDMSKHMRNENFLEYLHKIRSLGMPGYRAAIGEAKG